MKLIVLVEEQKTTHKKIKRKIRHADGFFVFPPKLVNNNQHFFVIQTNLQPNTLLLNQLLPQVYTCVI